MTLKELKLTNIKYLHNF